VTGDHSSEKFGSSNEESEKPGGDGVGLPFFCIADLGVGKNEIPWKSDHRYAQGKA